MRQRLASALFVASVLLGLAARAPLPAEGPRLSSSQSLDHHATLTRAALSPRTRVTPPLRLATLPPRIDLVSESAGIRLAEVSSHSPQLAVRADWFDARGPPLSS